MDLDADNIPNYLLKIGENLLMSRQARKESTSDIYHVMQRGDGKQILFEDYEDYCFLLKKIKDVKTDINFELLAYCLMPNHIHFLIKTSKENLSSILHKVSTSYACYYNHKYNHVGHIFQGRFRSEAVNDDLYVQACVRYIHNNPVVAGISSREDYKWSSYKDYILDGDLTDTEFFLSLIGGKDAFVNYSKLNDKDQYTFIDVDDSRLNYEDGLALIRSITGMNDVDGSIVNRMAQKERNGILRDLRKRGFTAKQIERLTGVPVAIIYKA